MILDYLLPIAASFVFLVLVFVPLERAFPAKRGQKFFRPEWWLDLAFFLGQYLLWSGLVLLALSQLSDLFNHIVPSTIREAVASQPHWLQFVEVILLSDFCVYWGHRLQHANSFLWRFHSVHHSAEHLDWLAAHREHPLDGLYSQLWFNLPAFLLGVDVAALAPLYVLRGLWAVFVHSNVRLPLGPLGLLLGDPALHRWHHARVLRCDHNFANLAPYLDVLFGTHHRPADESYPLGLDDADALPPSLHGQLAAPFTSAPHSRSSVRSVPPLV